MLNWIVILIVCLIASSAEAGVRDLFKIQAPGTVNLGTWSVGDGDLVWNNIQCIASSNYNNKYTDPPPNPAALHFPYNVKVRDLKTPVGFNFYLNNLAASNGNARINAIFEHRDFKDGPGAFEVLTDDVYDTHAHSGQFNTCLNGDNSEIQMTLSASNLTGAQAGSYRGDFRLQGVGGSSGAKTQSKRMRLNLTIADSVQISGMNNIDFGQWGGVAALTASEAFCVFSNNSTAGYTVAISGEHTDVAQFRMANSDESAFVKYSLSFDDSEAGAGATVTSTPITGVGNNTATDCGAANNANITVNVAEDELRNAAVDSYGDTITLLVKPE